MLFFIGVFIPFWGYSALVMEMNLAYRYQYPMYLSLVILLIILAKEKYPLWATIFLGFFVYKTFQNSKNMGILALQSKYNNMYMLADELSKLKNNTIALTESGILAWRTGWKANDMWGLNTPSFTNKLIAPDDIVALKPTLINIHAAGDKYGYLLDSTHNYKTKTWEAMCYNAFVAGKMMDYEIWMLPYDYRNYIYKQPPLKALSRIYYNLVNRYGVSNRYDMFMLDIKSRDQQNIKHTLTKYGGITWLEYKKRGGQ
jgi:hypothetical protein